MAGHKSFQGSFLFGFLPSRHVTAFIYQSQHRILTDFPDYGRNQYHKAASRLVLLNCENLWLCFFIRFSFLPKIQQSCDGAVGDIAISVRYLASLSLNVISAVIFGVTSMAIPYAPKNFLVPCSHIGVLLKEKYLVTPFWSFMSMVKSLKGWLKNRWNLLWSFCQTKSGG